MMHVRTDVSSSGQLSRLSLRINQIEVEAGRHPRLVVDDLKARPGASRTELGFVGARKINVASQKFVVAARAARRPAGKA
jgi:hypothetical protein